LDQRRAKINRSSAARGFDEGQPPAESSAFGGEASPLVISQPTAAAVTSPLS
jgi:hypothetical protein